ncbi:hypothetical protein ACUSIJ_25085 [Pseudochelatococcus sp. B33]
MKEIPECPFCGGTGWWWLRRSIFTADGFRKERCHTCHGSGKSTEKAGRTPLGRSIARDQAKFREQIAAEREARRKETAARRKAKTTEAAGA